MAKVPAKFYGECQCCGHTQKLPGGRLSKHGYTKRAGFFSGTCLGADELPFEQSRDLIDHFIHQAMSRRKFFVDQQIQWRTPSDITKAWVHEYVRATSRYTRSGYEWRYVDIIVTPHDNDGYKWNTFQYIGVDSRTNRAEIPYSVASTDVSAAIAHLNERYAKHFDTLIKQIDEYVTWQNARCADWKVRELRPV